MAIRSEMIERRRFALAIPSSTTPERMLHVQGAIDDARDRGVNLIATRINQGASMTDDKPTISMTREEWFAWEAKR